MDSTYTIGQLATAADIPTSTVRYYERAGLLRPLKRAANNYRTYN
jgi:DNA-binding transcriptional MerR regulator